MKLKKILTSLDGLHEELAKLYTKRDDGKFYLELEDDDAEPLRRAKEHEVGLRKIAEQERDTARTELAASQAKVVELTNAQNKDVNTLRQELTADHQRQVAELNAAHKKEIDNLNGAITRTYVDNVASAIAKDIALDDGAAELLTGALRKRLSVEIVNGEPLTRVLSPDGKASSMTPDELKNEYFTNEKYAGIMRASDASGGGASGGNKKAGGLAGKKLADLSEAERNTLAKENPAELDRLVAEARTAAGRR